MTGKIWRRLPAIIIMVIIFILSAMPGDLSTEESNLVIEALRAPTTHQVIVAVRKSAHLIEYAALGASLLLFMDEGRRQAPFDAWLAGMLYGVTDEIHQYLVPGRSGMISDVFIDSIGCLAGVLVLQLLMLVYRKRKRAL